MNGFGVQTSPVNGADLAGTIRKALGLSDGINVDALARALSADYSNITRSGGAIFTATGYAIKSQEDFAQAVMAGEGMPRSISTAEIHRIQKGDPSLNHRDQFFPYSHAVTTPQYDDALELVIAQL